MSYSVSGATITLTRGDTFSANVSISQPNGFPYTPVEGDKIRFAMKQNYADIKPILVVDVPIDTMQLILKPEDTKYLKFGAYVYDMQLTKANGVVDTFITKGVIRLTEEVD